jgi:hypothetical protein
MRVEKKLSIDKIITGLEERQCTTVDGKLFYHLYFDLIGGVDSKWENIFLELLPELPFVKKGLFFKYVGNNRVLQVYNTNIDDYANYKQQLDKLFNDVNLEYTSGEDQLILLEIEKLKLYNEK